MAPLHQTEHLPGVATDLECLAVELARERIEGAHDVADGLVAVLSCMGRFGPVGLLQHAGVRLGHHLLAEVDPDQVLLEDVVVEHVLGRLTQIHDLLAQRGRLDPVCHVLGVAGAGGVVVAANAADPTGNEVGVARILALHEEAVAAEDRRSAVAFGHLALAEIDLGVDPEAADDARDRVPCHLDQTVLVLRELLGGHRATSRRSRSRSTGRRRACATWVRHRACGP